MVSCTSALNLMFFQILRYLLYLLFISLQNILSAILPAVMALWIKCCFSLHFIDLLTMCSAIIIPVPGITELIHTRPTAKARLWLREMAKGRLTLQMDTRYSVVSLHKLCQGRKLKTFSRKLECSYFLN
jgi:hypothetical protein